MSTTEPAGLKPARVLGVASPMRGATVTDSPNSSLATTVAGDIGPAVEPEFSESEEDIRGKDIPALDQLGKPVVNLVSPSLTLTPTLGESSQGLMAKQPEIPEPSAPLPSDLADVPDIADKTAEASKPRLDQHTLTPAAIQSRTQRLFRLRANGEKKVSDEVWADWHAKGQRRKTLEIIFKRCGYDAAPRFGL